MSLVDWLFRLGMLSVMNHGVFKTAITSYLKDRANVKRVEDMLSAPAKRNIYVNAPRVVQFVKDTFGVELKVNVGGSVAKFDRLFSAKAGVVYDYEADSEKYLDSEFSKLHCDVKPDVELKCSLDSTQPTEQHCEVSIVRF